MPGKGTLQQHRFYEFKDQPAEPGRYYYRLKQIDFNGDFHYSNIIEVTVSQTPDFQLEQNYPNPFNQNTIIRYGINEDAVVTLKIYNLTGGWQETLINEYQNSGIYQISWDGKNQQGICLPSGIYFGRLTCKNKQIAIKMLLSG